MNRNPVVAGRFYPANPQTLTDQVMNCLHCTSRQDPVCKSDSDVATYSRTWGWMLPHAGYMYCGKIIGKTLSDQAMPSTIIILCPNHTGQGERLSVWPEGDWLCPTGATKTDSDFAGKLAGMANSPFSLDCKAHMMEHSIEVLLPFIRQACTDLDDLRIVPVCVGTQQPELLEKAGKILALALADCPNAGIIVSSDMNHYEDETTTNQKDMLAIDQILSNNPAELLNITSKIRITMCGVAPMALAMYCAAHMGKFKAKLICHDTSATASGDKTRTVGYAGMRFYLEQNNQ